MKKVNNTKNPQITGQLICAAMKASDLQVPEEWYDLQHMMANTLAVWNRRLVTRSSLYRWLQDAVNAEGAGMADRGERAIHNLRAIWSDRRVLRCCDCGCAIDTEHGETVFEGRCDRCSDKAEDALERLQDRQIAKFEKW